MYNTIIILMLISLIYNYLFKGKATNLNCGIFAWSGTSSDKFNPVLFNILGVYNDSRGGDSCGVYFNRGAITGIKTEAKYEALVKKAKLHTTIRPGRWPIVIGHCRKASVGTISEYNVQPTLFRSSEKKDKLMYVQAHNGTITNQQDLAKKYKIDVNKDESDSITLGKLIYKLGWSVLSEYEGCAALVMHFTKEPNALYVFHGKSKSYSTLTEERPLHYINIKDSGIYISSEAHPLEFIANGEKPTSFEYNIVYKIEGETITEVTKIEREKAILKEYKGVTSTVFKFDDNDNYYRGSYTNGLCTSGITKNICCSTFDFSISTVSGKIRYEKGFYVYDHQYAHGLVKVDTWGYIRQSWNYNTNLKTYFLYFYNGILLTDREAFLEIDKEATLMNIQKASDFFMPHNYNRISHLLSKHAILPFTRLILTNPGSGYMEPTAFYYNEGIYKTDSFFTGSFIPLFSDIQLHFQEGDLIGYKKYQETNSMISMFREHKFLREWGFGDEPKDIDVKSCEECVSLGIYRGGEKCMTCSDTFEEDKKSKDAEDNASALGTLDDNDYKVTLYQNIVEKLDPIVDSIEDLMEEIEVTGIRSCVQQEYDLLQEASETLKSIVE